MPGQPVCRELIGQQKPLAVRGYAFEQLHSDGRALIAGWIRRAQQASAEHEAFEAFIFAWVAFNGWAQCVVPAARTDRGYLRALACAQSISDRFEVGIPAEDVSMFAETWPIFRAQSLMREGLAFQSGPRAGRRDMLIDRGIEHAPGCWSRHGRAPADWPHTLYSLYQVRCNLFHGQKSAHIENDRIIVQTACKVLLPLVAALVRSPA
jgi:hypothetical protein